MEYKGLNDNKVTVEAGISNGLIGKARKRGSLSQENISKLLQVYSDLDARWLMTGDGKMLIRRESYEPSSTTLHESEQSYTPKVVTVDGEGSENIVFVPVAARAGYLTGYGDPQYLRKLPVYRMPKLNNGTFRMFEVSGHSMYPTIHQGSICIGEWCERHSDIQDNNIYIIVTRDEGIVIRRVLNRIEKYNNLYLKSDNRKEYPSYTITPEAILEIWKLKTALVFEFQDPATLYDRVNDLEAEIGNLKTKLLK